jgi:plastocyanin domain-containing protein
MKKFLILALVMFTSSVVFAAEPKEVFTAAIDSDGVQRVEVVGGSYFFKPDYIIVKVNVPVELKVHKESGIAPHDITIKAPEAGIDFKQSLGSEPKVVRFVPTKTGKYPMACSKKIPFLASHREKGMEGTLEVVE